VPFEDEASNYEFRLPILNSGIVSEHRDFVPQRECLRVGHAAMEQLFLKEVSSFNPDVIFNSVGKNEDYPSPSVLNLVRESGVRVVTAAWDSFLKPRHWEIDLYNCSDYLLTADSFTNYFRYRLLAELTNDPKKVMFFQGSQVFTDFFRPTQEKKDIDVLFLGSVYGSRVNFIKSLQKKSGGARKTTDCCRWKL